MKFYETLEIVLHPYDDDDDPGLEMIVMMLSNVDSEDFDYWYDRDGVFHMQFFTEESASICTELLKDMIEGSEEWTSL